MNTAHLSALYGLNHDAVHVLVGMLGAHFVSHDVLDGDTLVRYIAEAEAVSKS